MGKKTSTHRAHDLARLVLGGLEDEAVNKLWLAPGNLAPIWEPIAWFFKPYAHTITDVVLENEVGAVNVSAVQTEGKSPSNLVKCWFEENEQRWHEAQKPVSILEFLIKLATREGQIILDPFAGSGSTAVASVKLKRRFICFEINNEFVAIAKFRLSTSSVNASSSLNELPTSSFQFVMTMQASHSSVSNDRIPLAARRTD